MVEQEALDVLKSFYLQINGWELDVALRESKCEDGQMNYEESERIAMEEYRKIFADHCAVGATPRKFHYSEPPDYDPNQFDIERIDDHQNGSIDVYLRVPTDPKERIVFRLVQQGTDWRIQGKNFVSSYGELISSNL